MISVTYFDEMWLERSVASPFVGSQRGGYSFCDGYACEYAEEIRHCWMLDVGFVLRGRLCVVLSSP